MSFLCRRCNEIKIGSPGRTGLCQQCRMNEAFENVKKAGLPKVAEAHIIGGRHDVDCWRKKSQYEEVRRKIAERRLRRMEKKLAFIRGRVESIRKAI